MSSGGFTEYLYIVTSLECWLVIIMKEEGEGEKCCRRSNDLLYTDPVNAPDTQKMIIIITVSIIK